MSLGLINLSLGLLRKLQSPDVLAGYLSTSRTFEWFSKQQKGIDDRQDLQRVSPVV